MVGLAPCYCPESQLMVSEGSYDSTVRLWDLRQVRFKYQITNILFIIYLSAQSRQAIQTLDDARDAIQTLCVGSTYIMSGSVDGHIRTYDLRMGEVRADYLGHPVTSIVPTQDSQTVLAMTLDSHIRLMDMSTGKMLNDFTGHANSSYRCRASFGHGESSVICGDENGQVWAWDLLDVSLKTLVLHFNSLNTRSGKTLTTESSTKGP